MAGYTINVIRCKKAFEVTRSKGKGGYTYKFRGLELEVEVVAERPDLLWDERTVTFPNLSGTYIDGVGELAFDSDASKQFRQMCREIGASLVNGVPGDLRYMAESNFSFIVWGEFYCQEQVMREKVGKP